MRFYSDNAAPACPSVIEAIGAANSTDTAFDGDALSQRLDAAFYALSERAAGARLASAPVAAIMTL